MHQDPPLEQARRPARTPLWLVDFRERTSVSLWFAPVVLAVAAVAAGFTATWLDEQRRAPVGSHRFLTDDPSAVSSFAATIATATLAFVAVVFATTLVAIQLAASQYSPRAVRVFTRSRLTRYTMGLFIATFIFALVILLSGRLDGPAETRHAPVVSVSVLFALTLGTIFGFVAYLHGVVQLMRVQYLLETLARETRGALEAIGSPGAGPFPVEPPAPDPSARPLRYSGSAGVLAAVDWHGLVEQCRRERCWADLTICVGEYLSPGMTIGFLHGGAPGAEVAPRLLVRGERTIHQDPAYGFRQLVDTAIRALSPAVNDPTTAVQAIDRLNDLLLLAGGRAGPSGLWVDTAGAPRARGRALAFDALASLSFTEIIRYGADSPQVVRRLRAAFDELERTLPAACRTAIAQGRALLDDTVALALPAPFLTIAQVPDKGGLG